MKISLIVAMASNRVIGDNGLMPWHLSADLKKFRHITTGFPIVMGRKTYQSIGRPLPNRTNIIISRDTDYQQDGCLVFNDLDGALKHACQLADEVFIIGGATLYEALLPVADRLYITEIKQDFAGDTLFPTYDKSAWTEVTREDIDNDPSVEFDYSFLQLARNVDV
ncbi:dihydrofolate reductase [Crenothrix sp. D3]|jgi:dihydrofolate reductase|nr:dihydrofolate reductase [Crenothrix sp. D3]